MQNKKQRNIGQILNMLVFIIGIVVITFGTFAKNNLETILYSVGASLIATSI